MQLGVSKAGSSVDAKAASWVVSMAAKMVALKAILWADAMVVRKAVTSAGLLESQMERKLV